MTAQELIDELNKIEDKEQIILKYTNDGYFDEEPITQVKIVEGVFEGGAYLVD